ncbi:hypothetical protein BKA66DRAFT_587095 [Pyrenochaeta sp. MPI-SDFR-AT-0127]|nr:hypothetical protein BKA66DRAFT_587095 [Pyrenochaeta sp. MPI-SDFR-AT-0127]
MASEAETNNLHVANREQKGMVAVGLETWITVLAEVVTAVRGTLAVSYRHCGRIAYGDEGSVAQPTSNRCSRPLAGPPAAFTAQVVGAPRIRSRCFERLFAASDVCAVSNICMQPFRWPLLPRAAIARARTHDELTVAVAVDCAGGECVVAAMLRACSCDLLACAGHGLTLRGVFGARRWSAMFPAVSSVGASFEPHRIAACLLCTSSEGKARVTRAFRSAWGGGQDAGWGLLSRQGGQRGERAERATRRLVTSGCDFSSAVGCSSLATLTPSHLCV